MIAENKATWKVDVYKVAIGFWQWEATTEDNIGTKEMERSNIESCYTKAEAIANFKEYAKLNGLKYEIKEV